MNIFTAIGRVGRDAVTRHTQAGKPVTGWSLAVDYGWGDNKNTVWVDCSLWGDRGEKVAGYITKGSQLGVSGELGTREHDGKTYVTLNVRDLTLLGEKREGAQQTRTTRQESRPQRQEPQRQAVDDFADDGIPF